MISPSRQLLAIARRRSRDLRAVCNAGAAGGTAPSTSLVDTFVAAGRCCAAAAAAVAAGADGAESDRVK